MKLVLAIVFPCIYFLTVGRIFAAIISFFITFTGIGWLIAACWAYSDWSNRKSEKQLEAMKEMMDQRDQEKAQTSATVTVEEEKAE